MAESFVSVIADKVLGKLGSLAYQELCLAWGVKNDIQELANKLTTIKTVLSDLEEQQAHNPSQRLKLWLGMLNDVCYDAEDVLDEIEVEALRKQVIAKYGTITTTVRNFFSCPRSLAFRFKVGHKIKDIRVRLDKIAADKNNFNLTAKRIEKKYTPVRVRETHSFVHASDIIGRDEDKENIIKPILSPTEDENISVHTVVGLGGLGKTALAKLVYNDERVDKHFQLKIWVCVSEDFDLKHLLMKIIESATGQKYSESDLNPLQGKLQGILNGKRYLLVLDDVWNEVRERWVELETLLRGYSYGSKVIVTTRSHKVASIMGTMPNYNLRGLSHEDCMSLFFKCAFEKGHENEHPNLIKIGEEIVKKCGGIPLAVRTLGSLLFSSTDEQQWKDVRDNEIWKLEQKENDILHALKLSYDLLPSYLKPCFAYCSIFPKDYEFYNTFLIQFWIAHGLLQSSDENKDLEKIGNQYLKELAWRSFFQDFEELKLKIFYGFKMHDLMHDLAASLMKNESVILMSRNQSIPKTVRHLTFVDAETLEINFPASSHASHVRTILSTVRGNATKRTLFVGSLVTRLKFLRFLDFSDCDIQELPEKNTGNLKHLRFLCLAGNSKMKKLPNSIWKLHSLQTLLLAGCEELEELPRDIRYLINLRMLNFTTKQRCLPKNGIGCLNSLRFLWIWDCEKLECLFEDMDGLKLLQTLIIQECPKLMSLPHNMKNLSTLENLILSHCKSLVLNWSIESGIEDNRQDLNSTGPPLRTLWIQDLPELVELPQWLLQGTLQTLHIEDCDEFKALPESIQNLKSLQLLHIEYCLELSSLPENMNRLTALRELTIRRCPKLSERCEMEKGEDWPKIVRIPNIELDGEIIKRSD